MEEKKISLLDFVYVLFKHKNVIGTLTIISFIISVILYFFVLDLIYYSEATVKTTTKSSGLFGSIEGLADGLSGISELGEVGGKTSKELASYEQILLSRRCLEGFVIKFNLMERDDYDFMEDAIKFMRTEKITVEVDKVSGTLFVGVYDKDPALAKEMVDYLLTTLNSINIELSVQSAKSNREFIEGRYILAKEDLTKAEDSLKSFQLIYGIAPDLQIKASAQSVFTLEAELKAEEVKLDVVKKILSADQPEVKVQETKVNSLREKIASIQTSTDLGDFLRLGNSPQIAMSYLRLQRDLEIQTKILTFMLPVYEQAKIEEKKETPTILILDKPVIAEKKTKPKRLTMVLVITIVSFFIFFTIMLMLEYYNKFKKLNPEKMDKILDLMKKG